MSKHTPGAVCNICKTPFDTGLHADCGGDCLMCMAEAGDTDCALTAVTHLKAHRDALLEALKLARPYISTYTMDGYHAEVNADAAIKAAEEEA
jgi:hypothetical protein